MWLQHEVPHSRISADGLSPTWVAPAPPPSRVITSGTGPLNVALSPSVAMPASGALSRCSWGGSTLLDAPWNGYGLRPLLFQYALAGIASLCERVSVMAAAGGHNPPLLNGMV
jgi:hypothetical protein